MDVPPIDLTKLSRIALSRMRDTADVVGRDQHGRSIITVAVDGYVTVIPEPRFEVSHRIKEELENGRAYYALNG